MKKSTAILAMLVSFSGMSSAPWEKQKHKNRGKNPNNPAVRLAEQKRAMRAEKLRNRGKK